MQQAKCGCPTDGEFVYHRRYCEVGIQGSGRRIGIEWKPQDLWVGAYWRRSGSCVDLWICLLPCIPIHISWWWTREG